MFRGFGLLLVGLVLAGCISAGIGSDANALAANVGVNVNTSIWKYLH